MTVCNQLTPLPFKGLTNKSATDALPELPQISIYSSEFDKTTTVLFSLLRWSTGWVISRNI